MSEEMMPKRAERGSSGLLERMANSIATWLATAKTTSAGIVPLAWAQVVLLRRVHQDTPGCGEEILILFPILDHVDEARGLNRRTY